MSKQVDRIAKLTRINRVPHEIQLARYPLLFCLSAMFRVGCVTSLAALLFRRAPLHIGKIATHLRQRGAHDRVWRRPTFQRLDRLARVSRSERGLLLRDRGVRRFIHRFLLAALLEQAQRLARQLMGLLVRRIVNQDLACGTNRRFELTARQTISRPHERRRNASFTLPIVLLALFESGDRLARALRVVRGWIQRQCLLDKLGCPISVLLIETAAGLGQPIADLLRIKRGTRPFHRGPYARLLWIEERRLLARLERCRKVTSVQGQLRDWQKALDPLGAAL
jgi:hypothetical protein